MSGGRGASDRPLTYAGEYDAARTYLPREVVTSAGVVYMAVALTTGHAPPNATYWLALGGSGGGGVLGWAFVSLGLGTPTSNGTQVGTTGASLSLEVGDADLAFSGGDITLQASGDPCLYLVTYGLQADPTTNAVSTDVHQYECSDGNAGGFVMSIGTDVAFPTTTAQVICFPGPGAPTTPYVAATCTGGTNRRYNLVPYAYYTRLPFP